MNRFVISLLLLATLSACTGTGMPPEGAPTPSEVSPASSGPEFRCSEREKWCIRLTAEEPIQMGEPIVLKVTVTSEKDLPNLYIQLFSVEPKNVLFEKPDLQGWNEREAIWTDNAKADQPLASFHKLLLPEEEGYYQIIVYAGMVGGSLVADEITIYLTKDGGKVYFANTPIPTVIVTEPPYIPDSPTPTSIPTPVPLGAETSSP